jgi:hypothetical protein
MIFRHTLMASVKIVWCLVLFKYRVKAHLTNNDVISSVDDTQVLRSQSFENQFSVLSDINLLI